MPVEVSGIAGVPSQSGFRNYLCISHLGGMDATREQLLALPEATDEEMAAGYDSIALMNMDKQHESGYNCVAVVGLLKNEGGVHVPVHLLTTESDIVSWLIEPDAERSPFKLPNLDMLGLMRTDCFPGSGAMRMHFGRYKCRFYPQMPCSHLFIMLRTIE